MRREQAVGGRGACARSLGHSRLHEQKSSPECPKSTPVGENVTMVGQKLHCVDTPPTNMLEESGITHSGTRMLHLPAP